MNVNGYYDEGDTWLPDPFHRHVQIHQQFNSFDPSKKKKDPRNNSSFSMKFGSTQSISNESAAARFNFDRRRAASRTDANKRALIDNLDGGDKFSFLDSRSEKKMQLKTEGSRAPTSSVDHSESFMILEDDEDQMWMNNGGL